MKKVCVIVLAVLLVSVNVFAGGGGQQASAAAGKTNLIMTLWDNPDELGMTAIAQEFMRLNPDVTIDLQQTPFDRYEDRMRTILAGNDVPDVMQVNDGNVALYAERDLLLPLNDLVKQLNLDVSRFYQVMWQMGNFQGNQVCFPAGSNIRLMIYNRDLLKAAGLPDPSPKWEDPNWNWDTLVEYGQKLTKRQGNIVTQWGLGGFTGTLAETLMPAGMTGKAMFGDSGYENTVCSVEARPGIQFIYDVIHKYKISAPLGDAAQNANMFMAGQIAINMDASSSFASLREGATFDWDVAPIPMNKYGKTTAGFKVYGLPKKTKNPELAAKFLFFIGGEFAQQKFAEGGNIPLDREYAAKYYPNPNVKPSRQQVILDAPNNLLNVVNVPRNMEAKVVFRQYLHRALGGDMSVDAAMDQAKVEVDAILSTR